MQLKKLHTSLWPILGGLLFLAGASSAQRKLFVDKEAYKVIKAYEKGGGTDSVLHLTIEQDALETTYSITSADTQEAAAKRRIQGVFRYRGHYILLISNLTRGILIDATKQAQYRRWLNRHLKPESVLTGEFPNPNDSTAVISEFSEMIYEPATLVMRYRNGKLYSREFYRE